MYRIVQIQRKIVHIKHTSCLDLQKKLNIQNCINSKGNCVHWMFKFSAFAENYNLTNMLNEKNCINSTRNCVHWMYGLSGFAENYNSADILYYFF